MTQLQLDRQIADATGESIVTIRRRGFSVFDPLHGDSDQEAFERRPQWIDWDDEVARR